MWFIKQHGVAQNAVGSCCKEAMTVPAYSVVKKFCFLEVAVRPNVFLRILLVLITSAEDNYCHLF